MKKGGASNIDVGGFGLLGGVKKGGVSNIDVGVFGLLCRVDLMVDG